MNNKIKKVEVPKIGVIFNRLIFLKKVANFYETLYKNLNSVLYIVDLTSLTYLYNIPKAETDIASALDKDIEEKGGGVY